MSPSPDESSLRVAAPSSAYTRDTDHDRQRRAEIGEELARMLDKRAESKWENGAPVAAIEAQNCALAVRRATTLTPPDHPPMTAATAAELTSLPAEPPRVGDWGTTYTGRRYYPADPRPEDIAIEDIAHALSLQCRFGGHCSSHYSVAQHSVLVSWHCDKEDALWGLLHDASEAYLVDVPRPAKLALGDAYARLERRLMAAICERFELAIGMPVSVHRADQQLLATEARELMPRDAVTEWTLPEPAILGLRIRPWTPEQAEHAFLERFHDLWGARHG